MVIMRTAVYKGGEIVDGLFSYRLESFNIEMPYLTYYKTTKEAKEPINIHFFFFDPNLLKGIKIINKHREFFLSLF